MNKELARIKSASLDIKDIGIFTFRIQVDYENGSSQGIGGYALDTYDKIKEERIGTAVGCEIIRQLLLVLNVDDFSQMKGKDIWVLTEGTGLTTNPIGIQALKADGGKHIVFSEVFEQFKNK